MSGAKSIMAVEPDVIVGVPICRRTSFVLDKFLTNQREIQTAYPGCRLVLATNEPDFVEELREQINLHSVMGEVITYDTVMPEEALAWSEYSLPEAEGSSGATWQGISTARGIS